MKMMQSVAYLLDWSAICPLPGRQVGLHAISAGVRRVPDPGRQRLGRPPPGLRPPGAAGAAGAGAPRWGATLEGARRPLQPQQPRAPLSAPRTSAPTHGPRFPPEPVAV